MFSVFSELACKEHNVREAVDVEGPEMKFFFIDLKVLQLRFYVKSKLTSTFPA